MTGSEHIEESVELYYMSIDKLIPTKNTSLIPPATIKRDVQNKMKSKKQGTRY